MRVERGGIPHWSPCIRPHRENVGADLAVGGGVKEGDGEISLETEVEAGKHGIKRNRGVCVEALKEHSGGWPNRVEKVYYMSDTSVSGYG